MKTRILIIILMSIVLVLRAYVANTFLTLLFFTIFLFLIIFDKYRYKVIYLCYFLPWTMFIKINPKSFSLFSVVDLAFVLLFVFNLFRNGTLLNKKSISKLILFGLFVALVTVTNGNINIISLCGWILHMLTVYIFAVNIKNKQDKMDIILSLLCGTIVTGLIFLLATVNSAFMNYLLKYTEISTVLVGGRIFYRCSGLDYDPNYYSVLCLIFSWATIIFNSKKRFFITALSIMCLLFGLLSLSKMYLITIIISIFSYVLLMNRNNKKIKTISLLLVLLIILYRLFGNVIISLFQARLSNVDSINDFTTGRSDIWKLYIEYLISNPIVILFGNGMNGNMLLGHAAHNSFITGIYKFGLLGLVMMYSYYKSVFNLIKKGCNDKLLYYMPLLLLFISFISLDTITYDFAPYLLFVSILTLKAGECIDEENKKDFL